MTETNGNSKSKRTETAIKKVQGVDAGYLRKYVEQDDSMDDLKDHRVVPRLKIIQAMSDTELKQDFGEGTVLIRPGDAMVCKFNDKPSSFCFVPLFFFAEWAKWADLRDTSGPMILERSHDPTSDVAKKAKDFATMTEVYSGQEAKPESEQFKYRYVEHLRFIGLIYGDHPLANIPVVLSFERGEWGQGKNFISAVSLRREYIEGEWKTDDNDEEYWVGTSSQVPLWAQVWKFQPKFRDKGQNRKWYGFNFESADPPLIAPKEAETMSALHKEFKELFKQQRLIVQDEPTEKPSDPAAVSPEESF